MKAKHNILVLTYWDYNDPLIQAYTLPYLKIIKQIAPVEISIHLVTLEKNLKQKDKLIFDSETLTDVIELPYIPFSFRALTGWINSIRSLKSYIKKNNINTIHTWCTPAGMIGYILNKITKTRFVADSFEPHAEAMVENGTWKKSSIAFRLLFYFEKKIVLNANQIITIAPGMDDYIKKKFALDFRSKFIKPACVDLNRFNLNVKKKPELLSQLNLNDKIVCLYAGKFGGIYYSQEVFNFFKSAFSRYGNNVVFLILSNDDPKEINKNFIDAGIEKANFIIKSIPHQSMPEWMGLADFAICPVKTVPTKKYCSPIKTGEYWAMGLPVIITNNISNDSEIIDKSGLGYVWKDMSEDEYKNSLQKMEELLKMDKNTLSQSVRNLANEYRNFKIAETIYRKIYS